MASTEVSDSVYEAQLYAFSPPLALTVTVLVVGSFLVVKYREVYPLRGRQTTSMVVCNIAVLVWILVTWLSSAIRNGDWPCFWKNFLNAVASKAVLVLLMLRAWALRGRFEVAAAQLVCEAAADRVKRRRQQQQPTSMSDGEADTPAEVKEASRRDTLSRVAGLRKKGFGSAWYYRHAYLFQERNILRLAALVWVCDCAVDVLATLASGDFDETDPHHASARDWRCGTSIRVHVSAVLLAVKAVVLLAIVKNNNHAIEGYGYVPEFRVVAVTCLLLLVTWAIVKNINTIADAAFSWSLIPVYLFVFGYCLTSVLYPLALVFRRLRHATTGVANNNRVLPMAVSPTAGQPIVPATLRQLLVEPRFIAWKRAMREHLAKELSLETLIFWEEAEDYRETAIKLWEEIRTGDRDENSAVMRLRYKATLLWHRALEPGAPNEVNVSYVIRQRIRKKLEQSLRSWSGRTTSDILARPRGHRIWRPSIQSNNNNQLAVVAEPHSGTGAVTPFVAFVASDAEVKRPVGSPPPPQGISRTPTPLMEVHEDDKEIFTLDLFLEAQLSVYRLIQKGSWVRFLQSDTYEYLRETAMAKDRLRHAFTRIDTRQNLANLSPEGDGEQDNGIELIPEQPLVEVDTDKPTTTKT